MAVDTVGLHKGKTPIRGDRLVLQVEFATSLFGAPIEVTPFTPSPLARERLQRNAGRPEALAARDQRMRKRSRILLSASLAF